MPPPALSGSPTARAWFTGPPYISPYLLAFFVTPVSFARIHQTLKPLQTHLIALGIYAVIPTQGPRFSAVPILVGILHLSLPFSSSAVPAQSLSATSLPRFARAFFRDIAGTERSDSTRSIVFPGNLCAGCSGVPSPLLSAFRTVCTPGMRIDLVAGYAPAIFSIWLPDRTGLSLS